ncbi:hypothetical protein SCATT_24780 [Streptantibioticus cattleyicolor NRRL 8057 = DSM 46488]|uniref:Uncharacterized protein n=1 Tax=Streptantibioticus cattleyicolor (strain ATCC 35852 / DSM 46488 / JCM 4925 / NBRC 14057 / NRRL 8057) TaxID=1003195 RepID=G8WU27_STREN|nr:hypothetical protein SCATT_24780 [Streptantibioticus cattleyicolor NRRL 8057 = DSM 46488]
MAAAVPPPNGGTAERDKLPATCGPLTPPCVEHATRPDIGGEPPPTPR